MNPMSDMPDTIRITCPHCKVVLETDASVKGTRVACPECGREFFAQRDKSPVVQAGKSNSKKKRIFGIVLLAVALIFIFAKCFNANHMPAGNKASLKAQFVRLAKEQLAAQGGGNNWDVTWDDDALVITLVQDGLTAGAEFAALGTEPFVGMWNSLKFSMLENNHKLCDTLHSKGFENHLMFNLLDADDRGKPLLVILDGAVIYDATLQ